MRMKPRPKRFTLSISGRKYAELQAIAPAIRPFVDQIVNSALDDPQICARLVATIHGDDLRLS